MVLWLVLPLVTWILRANNALPTDFTWSKPVNILLWVVTTAQSIGFFVAGVGIADHED